MRKSDGDKQKYFGNTSVLCSGLDVSPHNYGVYALGISGEYFLQSRNFSIPNVSHSVLVFLVQIIISILSGF